MPHTLEQARLAAVFEAAVDGIIVIDDHGTVRSINSSGVRMFGWEADEIVGRNVKELMPEPYRAEHDDYLKAYRDGGRRRIIGIGREVVGRRRGGETFPMHLSVAEVDEPDERLFVGIVHDITAAKQAQRDREQLIAQLELKNAELERFTYTVSHDLKSPLITIKGFVGQLPRSVEQGKMERFHDDVERIAKAADKMKSLLDDVLELSRIGRIVNPPEDIALRAIVDETLELLQVSLTQRQAVVEVEPDMPRIRGDRTRLREVVQNLVENALKFSDGQPRIEIGCRIEDGYAVCWVRDDGAGLEPRYAQRIFDLFEQLDPKRSGTGVGLALVKRIVEVHGGRTWAHSAGLGQGLAVHFTLPLADRDGGDPATGTSS